MSTEIDVTGGVISKTDETGSKDILEIDEMPEKWLIETAAGLASEVARRRGQSVKGVMAEIAMQTVEFDKYAEIKEVLYGKLAATHYIYESITEMINHGKKKSDRISVLEEPYATEAFKRWLTDDKLAYIAEEIGSNPDMTFTPIMTLNIPTTGNRIDKVVEGIGIMMPGGARIYASLQGRFYDKYALAGYVDDERLVNIGLMPDVLNMDAHDASYQNNVLARILQPDYPFLQIPSVLEAVTYIGNRLVDPTLVSQDFIKQQTTVRCIDMPLRRGQNYTTVPTIYINHGAICPDASDVDSNAPARIMIL